MIGQVDGGGPNSDSESLDQSLGPRTPHLAYIKCCYNHKLNVQHFLAYPMVYYVIIITHVFTYGHTNKLINTYSIIYTS